MDLTLHFETWGEGARHLVLLHGFTGSHSAWDAFKPRWGQEVKAVAVDLPGHGKSPLPAATGREGWEETLAALGRIIEGLGASDVDLLGYSLGARVALGVALRMPDQIRRLVLVSGNPGLKRSQERATRKVQDEQLAVSIETEGVEKFVERWEAQPLFAGLKKLPPEVRAAIKAQRLACTAQGLAGSLRCTGLGVQPNYWPELPQLFVPTTLLTGADDEKFTDTAKKMGEELRHCWRQALPGAGHTPHLEVPEEFANEVMTFICAPYYSKVEFFGS